MTQRVFVTDDVLKEAFLFALSNKAPKDSLRHALNLFAMTEPEAH